MSRIPTFAAASAAAILLAACGSSGPSPSAGAASTGGNTASMGGGGSSSGAAKQDAMGGHYIQKNLVTDDQTINAAANTDANLVNAWGIAHQPGRPWWVSDNGAGVATLYDESGVAQFPNARLVVSVTGARGGAAANTGVVANPGTGFVVSSGGASGPARFLFASEDGTISGWNAGVPPPVAPATASTVTEVVVDNSSTEPLGGAVYKGITIASTDAGARRLYATDFRGGKVDVFDETFTQLTMPGAFFDPGIPDGFAPFGIQAANGMILVTYAKQDPLKHDDVAGRGLGFVSAFTPEGMLVRRVASAGKLNSPWGLAMAPDGFGRASGKLLVGNFGDGHIIAYDLEHENGSEGEAGGGAYLTGAGGPIIIDGLWGLGFGGGDLVSGPVNTLFFAAGPGGEAHGLFGRIDFVPPPGQHD